MGHARSRAPVWAKPTDSHSARQVRRVVKPDWHVSRAPRAAGARRGALGAARLLVSTLPVAAPVSPARRSVPRLRSATRQFVSAARRTARGAEPLAAVAEQERHADTHG